MTSAAARVDDGDWRDLSIRARLSHLPLKLRLPALLDDDELFEFCAKNRDLRIERTQGGEIIIMSPTGSDTGRMNFALIGLLAAWSMRDKTGVGFDSSTGFILPNGAERSPDAAWVKRERWDALTAEQRRKFAPLCPDFVAEIRSPSDDLSTLRAKLEEYLECGTRLGWLIDPIERSITVYQPSKPPEELKDPSVLSGEPVLPGFELDCTALW